MNIVEKMIVALYLAAVGGFVFLILFWGPEKILNLIKGSTEEETENEGN